MSQIVSLAYQPTRTRQEPPDRYNRVPVDQVTLIAGHGIEGDAKAGHNPRRHLNIMSLEMVEALRAEGFKANPGELGEQVVIDGLEDIVKLPRGTRLQMGDSAVVQLNAPREPCERFEQIQDTPLETAINRVGVMATVIAGGVVRVGDPVLVLVPVPVPVPVVE